jgi:hypothetical protein
MATQDLDEVELTVIRIMTAVAHDDLKGIRQAIQDHEQPVQTKGLLVGITVGTILGTLATMLFCTLTA